MATEHANIFKTPTASDPILAEVVRRLVDAYLPEQIYLFGSVARGDAGPDSDYDLMVVVPDDAIPERQRSRTGYRAIRHLGAARDIFVSKASDFRRQLHLKASFPAISLDLLIDQHPTNFEAPSRPEVDEARALAHMILAELQKRLPPEVISSAKA